LNNFDHSHDRYPDFDFVIILMLIEISLSKSIRV